MDNYAKEIEQLKPSVGNLNILLKDTVGVGVDDLPPDDIDRCARLSAAVSLMVAQIKMKTLSIPANMVPAFVYGEKQPTLLQKEFAKALCGLAEREIGSDGANKLRALLV